MIQSACLHVVRAPGSIFTITTTKISRRKRKAKERKTEKKRVQKAMLGKFS